ncbi:MAG TPA: hypothetical protein VJ810_29260, partial [Blastocatellia bacterium]|nr:hypothetical protein [Blastocatellia bacterium]
WAGLIAPPRTEKTPSGLTIQLDRAQKHNQVAAEDRSGPLFFWNKVAGVGLLVRPHGGQWRLASAATVRLRGVRVKRVYRLDGDAEDSLRAEVETYPNAWAGIYNVTVGNKTAPNLFAVTDTDVTVASSKLIEITPNTAPRGWNGVVKITVKDGHFNGGILPVVTFGEIFTQAATVPVRAHFRKNNELSDHIRYPFITYNQRSLIAASPLGDATRDAFTASNENPEAQQAVTFYEYDAVLDPNPSDLKLTPLRFGRRYQMAAFMIDLAGGLPRELAKTYPWVGLTEGLNAPEDAEVIQDFHYWRRVPIGQVRLSAIRNDSARWEAVNWPSLPEQCAPLSKELEAGGRIELTPEAEGRQLALLAETGRHSPVIGNEFIFGLRPPSVELAALERWGIESVPNAPASKKVLASYYRRLNRRQNTLPANAPLPTPDDDISLDDPAVTAYLITLETFDWETGGWGTPKGRIVLVSARAKGDDIGYFQQDWLRVRCVSGDSAQIEPTPSDEAPQEIKITIPQREATVARIQTHALAPKELVEGATARFPSDFFPSYAAPGGLSPDIVAKLEAYICLAPQTVVVETTNPDLPDPVELWQTLRARRQSDQSIALHLSPSVDAGPELAALFRNVMRCDLIKQVWRWQGRPLRPLPFAPEDWPDEAANIDDSAHVLRWEESAFAELDDLFDSLTIPLSYPLSLSSAQNEAPLYTDRPGGQKLAFYLRYAARVYSRYEPLYPDDARSQLSQQSVALKEGTALLTGPGWRRAFLPYRGGKPVKPVIKAIVPLTDGLAEMSELWLLAEREISPSPLLARLQAEQDPDTPGTCIRRRWQADSYLEERAAALLAEGASWPEAKLRRELCRLLNSLLDGDLYTGGERCWDSYLTESEVATLRQAGQLPAHELCRLNRQILLARAFKNEIMAPRDDQAAPLLIVVDEAMMAQAGITESLACRIESVSPPGGQMSLYQLGHDPILNLTAPDPGAPLLHRLIGPFGYTFDTDARQSLFNSSSYFLRPFGGAERWDFAQISLRRLTGDPELDQRGVDDTSGEEWTKPVWVQFVPPSTFGLSFDQLEVNSTPVGEAEQEVTITFRGSSFEAHALDWQGKYFTYGVLLTRRICDFRGHSGSEVYLTACGAAIAAAEQDAQISFLLPREWPETELVVRLIEVQETPHYDDTPRADVRENRGQGFWDRLFRTTPGANGDLEDAESRVTRLSPPFTIKQPKAE